MEITRDYEDCFVECYVIKFPQKTYFRRVFVTDSAVISALCRYVEVLATVPDQGEIYMENSGSAAHPAHSAVMSRPRLYLVEGKATRECLAIELLTPGLEMQGR